jgi:hypothetical protein
MHCITVQDWTVFVVAWASHESTVVSTSLAARADEGGKLAQKRGLGILSVAGRCGKLDFESSVVRNR